MKQKNCWGQIHSYYFQSHLPARDTDTALQQSQSPNQNTVLGEHTGTESRGGLCAKRNWGLWLDLRMQDSGPKTLQGTQGGGQDGWSCRGRCGGRAVFRPLSVVGMPPTTWTISIISTLPLCWAGFLLGR